MTVTYKTGPYTTVPYETVLYETKCLYASGVSTISRLLKILGLSCRILSVLKVFFARETRNFKERISSSHSIADDAKSHYEIVPYETRITLIPGRQPRVRVPFPKIFPHFSFMYIQVLTIC